MTERFDPYYTWLGIPPEEQPADYYRLLGVKRHESNADVISHAADQRLAHLRSLQQGKHAKVTQRLLNEIAAARHCLLDPAKRELYDRKLQAYLAKRQQGAADDPLASGPPADSLFSSDPLAADPLAASTGASRTLGRPAATPTASEPAIWTKPWFLAAVGGGVALLLLIVVLLATLGGGGEPPKPIAEVPPSEPVEKGKETPVEPSVAAPTQVKDDVLMLADTDYIEISNSKNLVDFTKPFTIELIARFDKRTSSHWLIGNSVSGDEPNQPMSAANRVGWEMSIAQAGIGTNLSVGIGGQATIPYEVKGEWTHVAFSSDGSTLYISGGGKVFSRERLAPLLKGYKPSDLNLHIGAHAFATAAHHAGFNGQLRAFRVSTTGRYLGSYKPPEQLLADDKTSLLLSFDATAPTTLNEVVAGRAASITGGSWMRGGASSGGGVVPQPDEKGSYALAFAGHHSVELAGTREFASWKSPSTAEMWVKWSSKQLSQVLMGTLTDPKHFPQTQHLDGWMVNVDLRLGKAMGRHIFVAQAGTTETASVSFQPGDIWHHVAYCNDENGAKIYIDGKAGPFPDRKSDAEVRAIANLCLGPPRFGPPTTSFHGMIRAFRLSNVRRYSAAFTPPARFERDGQTIALLDFSTPKADQIRDMTGSGRNGELYGAYWVHAKDGRKVLFKGVELAGMRKPANIGPSFLPAQMFANIGAPKTPVKKSPKPSDLELQAAKKEVKTIFAKEFATARNDGLRIKLANKLLSTARGTKDDPAARYALFDEALLLAVRGGDVSVATRILGELERGYEMPIAEVKYKVLDKLADGTRDVNVRKEIGRAALPVVKVAIDESRIDVAYDLAQLALNTASRGRDEETRDAARAERDRLKGLRELWNETVGALEKLKASPEDPQANLLAGKRHCLILENWAAGLPCLAKSNSVELRAAAQLDLAGGDPVKKLAIAEAWGKAANVASAAEKPLLLKRSYYWYSAAASGLSGLDKAKAEAQLKKIRAIAPNIDLTSSQSMSFGAGDPNQFPGMVGRISVDGRDSGILLNHRTGGEISQQAVSVALARQRLNGSNRYLEMVGLIQLSTNSRVVFNQQTGAAAVSSVFVDNKLVGQVGRGRETSGQSEVTLDPGAHVVRWTLSGADLGVNRLEVVDANANTRLAPFHSPQLLDMAKRVATKVMVRLPE